MDFVNEHVFSEPAQCRVLSICEGSHPLNYNLGLVQLTSITPGSFLTNTTV